MACNFDNGNSLHHPYFSFEEMLVVALESPHHEYDGYQSRLH